MPSLKAFRRMAGLPDSIRRWSQAAEQVKAGQKDLALIRKCIEDASLSELSMLTVVRSIVSPTPVTDEQMAWARERLERREAPPMDVSKWPVSNVTLAFPVGMPSDVALLGLCEMPKDVPVANQYDDAGNKLPDPVGICLSSVKFQIYTAGGEKLAEEAALPHEGKVRCVFGGKDLPAMWEHIRADGDVRVRLVAWPPGSIALTKPVPPTLRALTGAITRARKPAVPTTPWRRTSTPS